MIKSLRTQLVLALCAVVSIVGIVQGISSYQLSKAGMSALLDLRLEQVASRLRGSLGDAIPTIPTRGSQPARDILITIWRDDLETPYRSTDPSLPLPREAAAGFSSEMVNGEQWRIYTLRDAPKVIQVAQRSSVRHELAEKAAVNTLWPILVLVPLVCAAVMLVVRFSFRQLNRLGSEVQMVDAAHLQALPTTGVPIELRPFVDSINRMIERLARSMESERKFISDAAHELRTPLTALQLQADNLQRDIAPGNQERFQELRRGIARSGSMIAQMLRLARADASLQREAVTQVDVSDMVVAAVAEVLPIAMKRNIDIGAQEMVNAKVRAIEADLGIAIRNLVSNAIRYTPDGGKIDLRTEVRSDMVWIEVIDTGPGIADELLPRVFDRFFRANTDIEGSGLGLSIVKAIVARYGGTASLRNRDDGQTGIVASIGFMRAA
ncbi:ATP-binding protein [Paraburkholderia sp. SARCC-3016]|uniref:ATP-binding protein n=1 Tax=Paraburkholderia sp. SARCC-3016 TaxID=3058611 RepID=UPI0028069DF0|nr:ATP-binding protein [Paraburkholderia sp. SARCC-3016]MDQ7981301.1 ATP-binding protein [Paraburkholderia sp. SARCC-3016]